MRDAGDEMRRAFERDCRRAAISMALKVAAAVSVAAALIYTIAG